MLLKSSILNIEKKSVFLINLLLIFYIIFTFLFEWELKYFFYTNIIITFIISYIFFKRSRELSKMLILTNLFIFFYFLYPVIAQYLFLLLGNQSFIFILFYNLFLAYIFLVFSGFHKTFLRSVNKIKLKLIFAITVLGLAVGYLFYLVGEPVPSLFVDITTSSSFMSFLFFIIFGAFLIALSEQLIFTGFLYNTYRKFTTKIDAFYQVALIFVCFHILRFQILVKYYVETFGSLFIVFLTLYYIFLFVFMLTCLYLYTFKSKKYEGNFIYPVVFHFSTDLALLLFSAPILFLIL